MGSVLALVLLPWAVVGWLGPTVLAPAAMRRVRCPRCSVGAVELPPKPQTDGALDGHKVPISRATKGRVIGMYRQAQRHMRKGALGDARSLLRKCLRIHPVDAHSWLTLARLEASDGDVALARQIFERAHAACPSNVRLVHAHAMMEQRSGQHGEARRLFADATSLQPASAHVSHAWGAFEESRGNASGARDIYARAVALEAHPQVCSAWAALEVTAGGLRDAIAICAHGAASQSFRRGGTAGGAEAAAGTELL
eukprot:1127475-Prymnesium_polylepis.1